jgi:hypothetical protein
LLEWLAQAEAPGVPWLAMMAPTDPNPVRHEVQIAE